MSRLTHSHTLHILDLRGSWWVPQAESDDPVHRKYSLWGSDCAFGMEEATVGRTARRTVCLILRLLITYCDSDDALCTTDESLASCRQCFGVVWALGEEAGQVGCGVGR